MNKCAKKISIQIFALLMCCCFSLASSQSRDIAWTEEVVLLDGRVVPLKRVQQFDAGDYVGAHSLEFQNPGSNQIVKWQNDGSFRLVALFMVQNVPHILVKPTFGGHNERAGCPYPSMFIYKYVETQWLQIPYAESPIKTIDENVTVDPKAEREHIKANHYYLAAGKISVRKDPIYQHAHGLYLEKFPKQVFQCPQLKRGAQ